MHIDRIPNSVAQGLNWTNVGLKYDSGKDLAVSEPV